MFGRFWAALLTPLWLSRLILIVGVASVGSALSPTIEARSEVVNSLVPGVFPAAATTGTAAIGIMLILLARGLRRAKHRAWVVALILTLLAAATHLLKGLDVEESVMCTVVAVLLFLGRDQFTARPDARSFKAVLSVIVVGPLIAAGLGWIWLTVDGDGQERGTTTLDRVVQAFLGLIGIPGPITFNNTRHQEIATTALAVLGAAVLVVALMALLRPPAGPAPISQADVERMRALLDRWGSQDSLGYFTLRDDRSAIFGPGGAAISYRVLGGVSLSGGDPVGNPDARDGAISVWMDEARANGWTPAVIGAGEAAARAYQRAGLDVLELGDEAILHAPRFTLDGREMRGVRQAVSRCERNGLSTEVRRMRDLPPEEVQHLRDLAEEWRDGAVERGFSMALNRFGEPQDGDAVVVLARADDVPVGLLHFVPWGKDGLSLELMRRNRTSPNGVIETMVAGLMAEAPALGVERVSLNFAVFRGVLARGEQLGAGPTARLGRALLMGASRFWQIDSLYRSNDKYRPEWVPRYLVYPKTSDLAGVVSAVLQAEAFVPTPAWNRPKGEEQELLPT
ncbi:MAG TPA: phosphatidylglycerol lysyltransferase domain-containing protein [Nocardioides sp.]|nr:phosphatidylglycerol lysyltransferase domain-containing protein [Nocardioides sp.]